MLDSWKNIIGTVAPTLATALGGPLAGAAVRAIGAAFGLDETANEEAIARVVANATPEQLLALKNADQAFAVKMEELGVDVARIDAADRDSARKRQVEMNDWTPSVLAGIILGGWIWLNFYIFTTDIPVANKDFIMRTLGTVDAVVMGVVYFFFGSSAGSARLRDTLNKVVGK